jgi:hypothetical protein
MQRFSFVFLLSLLMGGMLSAQATFSSFAKGYEGEHDLNLNDLCQDQLDQVYMIGNWILPEPVNQLVLGKFDNDGHYQWGRRIGHLQGGEYLEGNSVKVNSQNDVVVAGQGLLGADAGYFVAQFEPQGGLLWQQYIFHPNGITLAGHYVLPNDHVLVFGHIFHNGVDVPCLVLLDPNGQVVAQELLETNGVTYVMDAVHTWDDHIILTGHSEVNTKGGDMAMFIAKLDYNLQVIWARTANTDVESGDYGNKVIELPNGNLLVGGRVGDKGAAVWEVSPQGHLLQNKVYPAYLVAGMGLDPLGNPLLFAQDKTCFRLDANLNVVEAIDLHVNAPIWLGREAVFQHDGAAFIHDLRNKNGKMIWTLGKTFPEITPGCFGAPINLEAADIEMAWEEMQLSPQYPGLIDYDPGLPIEELDLETTEYCFTDCLLPEAVINYTQNGNVFEFDGSASTGATFHYWDMGLVPGTQDTVQEVSFTYTYLPEPGSYEVCLVVSNDCGADTTCVWVTVPETEERSADVNDWQTMNQEPVQVFPNPASEFVEVRGLSTEVEVAWLTGTDGRRYALSIVSMSGTGYRLDLAQVPPGMYFLQMLDKTGQLVCK